MQNAMVRNKLLFFKSRGNKFSKTNYLVVNHLVSDLVIRVSNKEVCSFCSLKFELYGS
jgi:hypothetical protein